MSTPFVFSEESYEEANCLSKENWLNNYKMFVFYIYPTFKRFANGSV